VTGDEVAILREVGLQQVGETLCMGSSRERNSSLLASHAMHVCPPALSPGNTQTALF
jgi:hypothetical protein